MLFMVLLLPYSVSLHAEKYNPYLSFESFAHSEPIAIKAITKQWDAPLHNGDMALAFGRAEIGVGWNQWRLGVFRRHDYFYEFSPDTAYLKHSSENNLPLDTGKQLDIYIEANSIIANGVSLTHSFVLAKANVDVRLSYLKGRELTSGQLAGNAEVLAENDYDLMFDVDYFYSEDELFDREVVRPQGEGYSVDINIDWSFDSRWNFTLTVNDLLAKLFWKNAPRTMATGNTATKVYDEAGYVVFNPVISGLETDQNYAQTLPRKISFKTEYTLGEQLLLFEFQDFEIKRFYSIGAGFMPYENHHVNLFYNVTASALKVHYQNQWLTFSVISDEWEFHKARTFGVELSVTAEF